MDIPYTVQPRPDTGLYNAKVGIWLFLASEVMLFGALFSSYIILRIGAQEGTWPHGLLNIPIGTLNTLVLITSSITVVLAWASLKMNRFGSYKAYQTATILLALTFVVIKTFEYHDKFTHYDIRFRNEEAAKRAFEAAYGAGYMDEAKAIFHNRYGERMTFKSIEGVPFTGHFEKRYVAATEAAGVKTAGRYIEGNPMFFNTEKMLNPKAPVEYIMFVPDPSPKGGHAHQAGEADHSHSHGHHEAIRIDAKDIRRLSAYVPAHSTYFSIYFTLTALHALHVIGGALVIAYIWGPGASMWKTDPERYTNRVEVSGLFWHFVDLVWIFLFPVLYLL